MLFRTEACGRPVGAAALPWINERLFYRYSTPRHGDAVRWEGEIDAEHVEALDDIVTWLGIGTVDRYKIGDRTFFRYIYIKGSPYDFDYAEFVMEQGDEAV